MQRSIFMVAAVLVFAAGAVSAHANAPAATPSPEVATSPSFEPSPPAASPTAVTHVRSLPVDGAFSLPGEWNCETLADSNASSSYKLLDRRHIEEHTTLHLPDRPPVKLDSLFTFDAQREQWNLSMQKGAYTATAPVWSGETWMFEGVENDATPHRPVRLVYTSLGPDAFRSDFQAQNHGVWQTFSGATCKRYVP